MRSLVGVLRGSMVRVDATILHGHRHTCQVKASCPSPRPNTASVLSALNVPFNHRRQLAALSNPGLSSYADPRRSQFIPLTHSTTLAVCVFVESFLDAIESFCFYRGLPSHIMHNRPCLSHHCQTFSSHTTHTFPRFWNLSNLPSPASVRLPSYGRYIIIAHLSGQYSVLFLSFVCLFVCVPIFNIRV